MKWVSSEIAFKHYLSIPLTPELSAMNLSSSAIHPAKFFRECQGPMWYTYLLVVRSDSHVDLSKAAASYPPRDAVLVVDE